MKVTNNPESENPGANDDGGGDRRNHGDYLGTTDAAEEQKYLVENSRFAYPRLG
jgi:hypothetical protein